MPSRFNDIRIYPPCSPSMLKISRYGAVAAGGRQVNLGPMLISSRAHRLRPRRLAPATGLPALGPHIWVGTVYAHFGHFIAETLPRLLSVRRAAAADSPARLLTFVSPQGKSGTVFPVHVHWFADRLGLDLSRVDVVHDPVIVRSLTVPPPPFLGRFAYQPGLRDLIRDAGLPALRPSNERIFLRRSQLPTVGPRAANGPKIEDIYAQAGYTVLHPERLSLDDQLLRITAASTITGENGSALHWSLYSPHIRPVQSLGWDLALQRGFAPCGGKTIPPCARHGSVD